MIDLLDFRGRTRVRTLRQTEASECGLACLAMVMWFHGRAVDLATLRRRHPVGLRGMSLRALIAVAGEVELTPRPVRCSLEELGRLALPAILHWDLNHFVVLERRTPRGRYVVHDPARGERVMTVAEVSPHYTGVALELRPTMQFRRCDERARLRLGQLWSGMRGLGPAVGQVLLLTLVMQLFVVAMPYFLQLSIDRALPGGDRDLLLVLALGFAGFTLISVSASVLRGFVLMRAGASIGFQVASNLARHMLRLPISFFERRSFGDVLSRFEAVEPIQRLLTSGAVGAVVDGGMALVTLGLMLLYSPLLAGLAVTAVAAYVAVRALMFPAQRARGEAAIVADAEQSSLIIETLRGIVAVRLFGREDERHVLWQNRTAAAVNAGIAAGRLQVWQSGLNQAIFGLEAILSIYLAVRLAMAGGFTTGMVFAFMAFKQQFVTRAASLADQFVEMRLIGLQLERLADIALQPADPSFAAQASGTAPPLRGEIRLEGVTYRYAPGERAVLDGLDLHVGAGEHLAITGASGGGKTTLLKILLGLVEPEAGRVLVDGRGLDAAGMRGFRRQVAAVLQDDVLFAGSLADNIAFLDPEMDRERVERCARLAAVHDEIEAMPMRYETLVGDMGAALSGGQRQRVLLARALYRGPRILFMDEGTAHLDAETERAVNAAVTELGITRIVVAHRRETIRAADRVLELTGGRLLARSGDEAPNIHLPPS